MPNLHRYALDGLIYIPRCLDFKSHVCMSVVFSRGPSIFSLHHRRHHHHHHHHHGHPHQHRHHDHTNCHHRQHHRLIIFAGVRPPSPRASPQGSVRHHPEHLRRGGALRAGDCRRSASMAMASSVWRSFERDGLKTLTICII